MNRDKVVLIVLVGLPSSGKTSFCDRLKGYLEEKRLGINLYHVCFDKLFKIDESVIRTGDFKTLRRKFWELVKVLVEAIYSKDFVSVESREIVIKDLSEYFDAARHISYVIVDDNNYYRSMRYPFYQLARETLSSYCQIYMDVETSIAVTRDQFRTKVVGEEVIQKMSLRLEKPVTSNSWERRSLFIEIDKLDMDQVLSFLEEVSVCTEHSIEEKVQRPSLPQSEIHQIDLILRGAINKGVQQADFNSKALTAHILQKKRKSILQDIRDGIIQICNHTLDDFEALLYNHD